VTQGADAIRERLRLCEAGRALCRDRCAWTTKTCAPSPRRARSGAGDRGVPAWPWA
jgi:hypothetical protein